MASLTDYRGLDVVENATGAGGAALTDNFKELADRAGTVHAAATDPTADNDSDDTAALGTKFTKWSKWHNTSTDKVFLCVDATPEAAVWVEMPTMPLIAADVTLHVSTSGSDSTGDGSSGSPWATVAHAMEHLKNKWIAQGVTVTIDVAAGTYTATSLTNLSHPCGARIRLQGATPLARTLSSIVSSSGSASNWSLVLQLNDASGISAGDFVLIRSTTGGSLPEMICGCHKITSVDGANNRVTVSSNHSHGTAPSGAVTGSVDIVQTVLQYNGSTGLYLSRADFGEINNLVIAGNRTASTYGVYTIYDVTCSLGNKVGINGFHYGLYARNRCQVNAAYLAVSNCVQFGLVAQYNTTISAAYAVASGNNSGSTGQGFSAYFASPIYASHSIATGNIYIGYYASFGSTISCHYSISSAHTHGAHSDRTSTVYAANSTLSHCTAALYAMRMGHIDACNTTVSNCTNTSSPAVNTAGNQNSYVYRP